MNPDYTLRSIEHRAKGVPKFVKIVSTYIQIVKGEYKVLTNNQFMPKRQNAILALKLLNPKWRAKCAGDAGHDLKQDTLALTVSTTALRSVYQSAAG